MDLIQQCQYMKPIHMSQIDNGGRGLITLGLGIRLIGLWLGSGLGSVPDPCVIGYQGSVLAGGATESMAGGH